MGITGREMALSVRRAALFLIVCIAARETSAIQDGLLPNGNFEQAPNKSQLNGTRVLGRYAIPHWEVSGFVEYIGSAQKYGDMHLPVPEGAYAVRLGNEASIQQRLAVQRSAHYAITFCAGRTCAQAERLNVTVAPQSDVLPIQTVYTSSGWDCYSWAFKARHSTETFIVHNPGVDEDPACGPLVDLFAIKTLQPPQRATNNNMLKNGDFEQGPYVFPNTPWGVLLPPMDEDDYSPVSPWTVMSSSKSVKYVDSSHYKVPHGARAVELMSGMETALVQDVPTVPGRSYRLQFAAGDGGNGCAGSMAVQAYAARGSVRVPYQSQGKGGCTRGVLDFTAIANQTRVAFVSMSYTMKRDGTLCGPVLDDVSLVCTSTHRARRLLL